MRTLPDFLDERLRLLSVGLNPSLPSVRAGYYFANPRNRFWRALNASRLLSAPVVPGPGAERALLARERIGFSDLVKRPTRGAGELRARDYRRWAPLLADKIARYAPACVWFHGRLAWEAFVRHALGETPLPGWGLQARRLGASAVFVTPNPSPANAAFSLADLIAWYDRLADTPAGRPLLPAEPDQEQT